MAKRPTKPGDPDQGVMLRQKDAQRVFNVVHWYENSNRPRNPSKLPRAPGGGGGGLRLCQFSGGWTNEPGALGDENLKLVTLYQKDSTSTSANAWIPEEDGVVLAINLMSYVPTPKGGPSSLWGVVTKVAGGSFSFSSSSGSGTYDTLWLLIAAQC